MHHHVGCSGLVDERAEKAGRKIRDAEVSKIPYMLIVGEKEDNEGTVSVRKHGGEDLGVLKLNDFIQHFTTELESLTKFNNNQ